MSKMPLVTVTITCYNYADYVKQSILSVISQTYKNIELTVINDGSTDNSHTVIDELKEEYNFKYINQPNKGIIATRNIAAKNAKGEFQMQLDADDYLDPMYVEKCVSVAQTHGADIIYTQVHVFGRADFISQYINYDLEKLKHDNYIHASALIRSKVLPDQPYDVYLDKKGYEDWDVFLDLCLDGAKASLVDEPLLHYRKHVDRKSRSDEFADIYKELLVRHHIWSKQNAKHPDHFWYFSSQIETLLTMINLHNEFLATKTENDSLRSQAAGKDAKIQQLEHEASIQNKRILHLERRDPISIAKKIKRKLLNR